ncbi:TonB-dependent siderophore receptor [Rhizobium lusitanum]|uniref:TonB-dependent siderophore receptor n=2 Tax=Rhizobium TaxID=379 RepID=A0A6L9UAX2_9HYPH|nr:TonB-dependent receptor [Rhizobium lusitanum]NEI72441.1 TonB-dependent siderophore receptor [Rhizobium lusitanum]
MRGTTLKSRTLVLLTATVMAGIAGNSLAYKPAFAQAASDQRVHNFDILAKPIRQGMNDIVRASGINVVFTETSAASNIGRPVRGSMSTAQAIATLLAGSGLQYSFTNSNTVTILGATQVGNGATTTDATTLAPIVVQGNRASSETSDPYASQPNPSTEIGSKEPLTQREIPQTLSTVTQKQIREQSAQSLNEVLEKTPGVTVLQSDSSRYQYYARGFPISNIQVDGLPISTNPNLSQTSSTGAPNLAMFDRVEVLDGPAGLYNGFGSPGGAINLVRKRAQYEFSASTELGIGSEGGRHGVFDVGGPLNPDGTVRARFVGDFSNEDLTQATTWKKDRSFYGTIEADLTPDTLLRLGASYGKRTEHTTWVGSPLYTDLTPVGNRSDYFGSDWNRDSYEATDVYASIEHKFDNDWKIKFSSDYSYLKNSITQTDIYTLVDPTTNLATIGSNRKDGSESNKSLDLYATGPYSLLGRTHQLTIGANYARMDEHQTTYYGAGGDDFNSQVIDVFNFIYAKPVWLGLPTDTDEGTTDTTQYGIYGNTRISLTDSLTAILGGRVTWWNSDFGPDAVYNYDGYTSTSDRYNGRFTPYAGLVYKLNDTYSLYGSYSTVFQPQSDRDSSNQVIAPIEGDQFEAGVKGEFFGGDLIASAAVFQITQKNRAVLDPSFPLDAFYLAQGKARTRGIDLRVSGEVADGLTVTAGYTYNNSKYLDEDSSDSIASNFSQIAPTHLFKIWGNYRLPGQFDKWEVGAGLSATSELYYERPTGKITQPGYVTIDARVAYNFNDKVSLNLNGTNIFDRQYFQPANHSVEWGEPAKVMLTLRAKY